MADKALTDPVTGRRAFVKKIGGAAAVVAGAAALPRTGLSTSTLKLSYWLNPPCRKI